MIDIHKILNKLALKRPIFHSEADLQHELAWLIHEEFPTAQIRLEIPSGNDKKNEHLDIVITLNMQKIVIELKFKKRKLQTKINAEDFNLKSDTANDTSRYDYLKDVCRIEEFIKRNSGAIGYAIMITNEENFWREMKLGQNSEQFFLHEGRKIIKNIEMGWHSKAGVGTKLGRTEKLKTINDYIIKWNNYSKLGDGRYDQFKSLVIEIGKLQK